MSFVEFLIENYVLIISIIIILVVGVIGFIVDANQKDNENKITSINNNNEEKNLKNNEQIDLEPQKLGTKISPQPTVDFQNLNQTNKIQQDIQLEPLIIEPSAQLVQPQPVVTEQASPVMQPQPVVTEQASPVMQPQPVVIEQASPVIQPQPVVTEQASPVMQPQPVVTEQVPQPQPYNPSVVTTNGSQPFDISSMFANNK